MSRFLALCIALAGLASGSPASAGDSMRCGSRLVAVEARAAEILGACGEPSYRDVWSFDNPRGGGWIADTEEWTYNFGPNQLIRILRLRNGRLVDIETDGYGFSEPAHSSCPPISVIEGLSKYRLLSMCGEPLTRRASSALRPLDSDSRVARGYSRHWREDQFVVPVYREEWVYNFGAHYLMREVTLENGRVVDVQNADRGFDP